MEKRTMILISIITTILSLLFIALSYFGITRYLSLHLCSYEKFLERYKDLPKASDNRVVLTFTTTPEKIGKLKPMINSLLDQTVRVNQIIMVIPECDKRKYDIPDYLKNIVTIIPSGKNYGEGTKLIPTLLREKDSDTIIIAINDNMIYGKDFLQEMIEKSNKNPNTIILENNNNSILVKPICFDIDVINRGKEEFDNDWFVSKAKNNKILHYSENYKCL
jgi:hypothetical protein